jgi:hypothetical protein
MRLTRMDFELQGASILEAFRPVVPCSQERQARWPACPSVTKVEFYINLKTAKTAGTTFPLALLGRADRVIE